MPGNRSARHLSDVEEERISRCGLCLNDLDPNADVSGNPPERLATVCLVMPCHRLITVRSGSLRFAWRMRSSVGCEP